MEQVTGRARGAGATSAADLTLDTARLARPEPFESFYRRELPKLVALSRALCGPAIADDIAQEAMLAAYRKWDTVSQLDIPEAWLRRVCLNLATSVLRRRTIEAAALLRMSSRRELAPIPAEHETFWAAVRSLPRRQAQAAALRYVYGMSVLEIASTLGCSEGSTKVHLSRARAALARTLGADLDEEVAT